MASAAAVRRLTQAHRLAQIRVAGQTIVSMRAAWRLLDPSDVDGSFAAWLDVVLPTLDGHRATSAQIAANYVTAHKQMHLSAAALSPVVLAGPLSRRAASTSLLVTGPLSIKRAMTRGVRLGVAARTAEESSAAAAMRMVLDAGRDTIRLTVSADRDARGWERVASGNACAFCAGLDGVVFSSESAGFEAHDRCACSAAPVYK